VLFFHLAFATSSFTSSGLFMLQCFANLDKSLSAVVIVASALPFFFSSHRKFIILSFWAGSFDIG
jgi:hypothetical protein